MGRPWTDDDFDDDLVDIRPVPPINMPAQLAWAYEEPRSDHPGGVHILMCDSSVGFLSNETDVVVLRRLATRAESDLPGI